MAEKPATIRAGFVPAAASLLADELKPAGLLFVVCATVRSLPIKAAIHHRTELRQVRPALPDGALGGGEPSGNWRVELTRVNLLIPASVSRSVTVIDDGC